MKWKFYRVCGDAMLLCAWLACRIRFSLVERVFLAAADYFFIPLYMAGEIKESDEL